MVRDHRLVTHQEQREEGCGVFRVHGLRTGQVSFSPCTSRSPHFPREATAYPAQPTKRAPASRTDRALEEWDFYGRIAEAREVLRRYLVPLQIDWFSRATLAAVAGTGDHAKLAWSIKSSDVFDVSYPAKLQAKATKYLHGSSGSQDL